MDGSPPGSSVHGIVQIKILEWVAIPFSRRSSQPHRRTAQEPSLVFLPIESHGQRSLEGYILEGR